MPFRSSCDFALSSQERNIAAPHYDKLIRPRCSQLSVKLHFHELKLSFEAVNVLGASQRSLLNPPPKSIGLAVAGKTSLPRHRV